MSGANHRSMRAVVNRKHALAVAKVAPIKFPLRNSRSPPTSIPSAPVSNAMGTKIPAWMLMVSALASDSAMTEQPNAMAAIGTPLALSCKYLGAFGEGRPEAHL